MRRALAGAAALTGALLLYLLAWPVPVEPQAWQPPPDPGHVDPFDRDPRIGAATALDLGEHRGPEDAAIGPDGRLYASSKDGDIVALSPRGGDVEVFAAVGGRPLGIEFDAAGNLWVANALAGLQRISPDGRVETLVDVADGLPVVYADDVAVAADGRVYFSDATQRFSPREHGGTYGASLLDILEHGTSGRVVEFDPASGRARTFADGLNFANGVAVSADQRWLFVAETGSYTIWRYPLAGGSREPVIRGLPDFPDNLNNGLHDRIWVGLIAPRVPIVDRLADQPFLRKLVQRLPAALRPQAEPHAHVIAINAEGDVLMNLYGDHTSLAMLTGVVETADALYLTSLVGPSLGRLDKRDLAPR